MGKCTNTHQIIIASVPVIAESDTKQSSPILTHYDTEFSRRSEGNKLEVQSLLRANIETVTPEFDRGKLEHWHCVR